MSDLTINATPMGGQSVRWDGTETHIERIAGWLSDINVVDPAQTVELSYTVTTAGPATFVDAKLALDGYTRPFIMGDWVVRQSDGTIIHCATSEYWRRHRINEI